MDDRTTNLNTYDGSTREQRGHVVSFLGAAIGLEAQNILVKVGLIANAE